MISYLYIENGILFCFCLVFGFRGRVFLCSFRCYGFCFLEFRELFVCILGVMGLEGYIVVIWLKVISLYL